MTAVSVPTTTNWMACRRLLDWDSVIDDMVRRKVDGSKTRKEKPDMISKETGASFYLWWIVVCGRENRPTSRLIKQARRLALLCFALLRVVGDILASWILFCLPWRRQGRSILHSPFESSDSEQSASSNDQDFPFLDSLNHNIMT
jgi:hypothetical protein